MRLPSILRQCVTFGGALDALHSGSARTRASAAWALALLYHGLRREELCRLKIKAIHPRRGVPHLRVHGKGDKTRYIPLHAGTQELLNDYLDEARHAADTEGALFRPVSNNRTGELDNTITPDGVYKLVRRYSLALGPKIGAQRPPPMLLTTKPISLRFRNGWVTPILRRHAFMIGGR